MSYTVRTTDPIVLEVIKKIDERSLIGQEKYGDTMMSEVNSGKKDLRRFMIDAQEEITDMLLYMESARHCLQNEIEECYINDKFEAVVGLTEEERERRMNIIGQNGNTGEHYDNPYWIANQT